MPADGHRENSRRQSEASSSTSSRSSRCARLERVLAVGVAQAGRQLEVGTEGWVAVLPQARHPLVLVDGQHDHGARVLEDPAPCVECCGSGG